MKILVVEDDKDLLEAICAYLTRQYHLCETASTFRDALQKIDDYSYDCIVLDLGMPGGDGLQLLELVKSEKKQDGIIIVSARNQLDDRVRGLDLGADDYLTKPFHLPELHARITAIIRRKQAAGGHELIFEEIRLDVPSRAAFVNDQAVALTPKEYELLSYFIVNKNRVLSKSAIASHLWGDEMDVAEDFNFLYGQIKNLRRKLMAAGAVDYIQSAYGTGYKFSLR